MLLKKNRDILYVKLAIMPVTLAWVFGSLATVNCPIVQHYWHNMNQALKSVYVYLVNRDVALLFWTVALGMVFCLISDSWLSCCPIAT